MTALVSEGKTNVYWVVTIANKNAPTVAEITAGTNLRLYITKDGVNPGLSTNNVDAAMISDTFDAQNTGSWGGEFELTMRRDDTADTAWNLCIYGTVGFIVVDRFRAAGTLPSAGQKVEVWPAQMHQPIPQPTAANTLQKFVEKFAITSQPNLSATVA